MPLRESCRHCGAHRHSPPRDSRHWQRCSMPPSPPTSTPPRQPPSFAARTPPCDSVVTIDPTALSPASATTPSLMAAAADVIINPTALLSASAAPPSLLLSFMHRRANFCTCFHHDSAGRCCLCSFADAASDATTAAGRFPCWHDAVSAADTMRPRCGCRRRCRRVEYSAASTAIFCRSNDFWRFCWLLLPMSPSTPPLFFPASAIRVVVKRDSPGCPRSADEERSGFSCSQRAAINPQTQQRSG